MKPLFNPCNKCLVKVCCTRECQDHYEYTVLREQLLYVPNKISELSKDIYKAIKSMYKGEPIIVKFLVTILLTAQLANIVLLIGLLYTLIYGLCNSGPL